MAGQAQGAKPSGDAPGAEGRAGPWGEQARVWDASWALDNMWGLPSAL